jgi:hypothetical protein
MNAPNNLRPGSELALNLPNQVCNKDKEGK